MIESAYQLVRKAVEAKPGAAVAVSMIPGNTYYSVPIRDVIVSEQGTLLILIDAAGPPTGDTRSEEIP